MRVNPENRVLKPHWIPEEEWEGMCFIDRLKALRNYAADNTSMSLLLEIREEIRYYERVLHQIRELTG